MGGGGGGGVIRASQGTFSSLLPLIQEQISVKYTGKALYIRDATKFLRHRLMQHSIMTKWSVVFGSHIDLSATYREAYTYRETMTSLL